MKRQNLLTLQKEQRGTGYLFSGRNHFFVKKRTIRILGWIVSITGFLFLGSCKTCQCPAYSSVPPSAAEITAQNRNVTPESPAFIIQSVY